MVDPGSSSVDLSLKIPRRYGNLHVVSPTSGTKNGMSTNRVGPLHSCAGAGRVLAEKDEVLSLFHVGCAAFSSSLVEAASWGREWRLPYL